jgi:hypothetical protein
VRLVAYFVVKELDVFAEDEEVCELELLVVLLQKVRVLEDWYEVVTCKCLLLYKNLLCLYLSISKI